MSNIIRMPNLFTFEETETIVKPDFSTTNLFDNRTVPWANIGTNIRGSADVEDAIYKAKLDWKVIQEDAYSESGLHLEGYKANLKEHFPKNICLGIVKNRYEVIQNYEALSFMDLLLDEGAVLETAGCSHNYQKVWLEAKLPERMIGGEKMSVYLIVINSHNGQGSLTVALTPVRVVCQNMFNLALKRASRTWSCVHSKNMKSKIENAKKTLFNTEVYMDELHHETENLKSIILPDDKVEVYIDSLLQLKDTNPSLIQIKRNEEQKRELKERYFNAPDLKDMEKSAYRFVNAVSDFVTHTVPPRKTKHREENVFFNSTLGGKELKMIDTAYSMMKKIA